MLSWIAGWPTRPRACASSSPRAPRPPLRALQRLLVEGEGLVLDRAAWRFAPTRPARSSPGFGLLVSEEQARVLAERTEGWAAALSLVAQAAQSGGLPALMGTPREIFDYLATAVVDGLPDELQAFAMHTSVLFVLTPDICAALTGADARACLDALEARSLFLTRLDEDGPRYRYHQLFSEFLQQRLAGRQPALVVELHRRAGAHLEREGRGDEAVRHFLLAGAYPDAVRVLVPYRGGRLTARRAYVFRDLVRRLPRAVADAHPWLLRTAASSCRFIGDYEQALTWSRQAMAAAEGRDVDLWAHAVHGVGVMLRSLGRLGEALTTLEAAVERLPAGVSPGMACCCQALALVLRARRSGRARDDRRGTSAGGTAGRGGRPQQRAAQPGPARPDPTRAVGRPRGVPVGARIRRGAPVGLLPGAGVGWARRRRHRAGRGGGSSRGPRSRPDLAGAGGRARARTAAGLDGGRPGAPARRGSRRAITSAPSPGATGAGWARCSPCWAGRVDLARPRVSPALDRAQRPAAIAPAARSAACCRWPG
jgi:tetratricopeptide (TPR) repeat protein